ncbi:DUF3817 domain-containing protein [Aldersonia sp. NBC_00410]|uniref:DUF3817 domain-containing protein n=1 Tax=Aldersonia sp. NBC_00410 TaxID=2975954 RepID=UPI002250658A|nr:DUF3817 domain-containing protein [Aldersonia sp. NBC_00410]MCX5042885.1 DUF3817 domain-containing protein [Aldersonia sp. NBC_00410]
MTASPEGTETAAPTGNARIAGALLRYRVLAWVTGIWLLVLTADLVAKYGFDVDTPSWIAVVHGWVYFVYLIVTIDLAVKVRWAAPRTVGTLLAGTIPFLSFFVEHRRTQQVKSDFGI